MTIEQAEQLMQKAYSGEEIDLQEELNQVGIMSLHKVYYDGGFSTIPEIREILRDRSHPLSKLIRALRDARLDDYSSETLNKMYGLLE
jgi:hypothetical protein